MYWNSKIHSLVLISCHKNTSRICPLIVMFLMMPALLRQGKIFYKHLQQDFLKKNHFSKILASLITNVKVCIPKYEQYPSTNVLSTRINGRPIIFARALNQPSKNIPEKEKKKMNFPIPWQERLCRSLRGTRKERRNRSLRVSLLGTLFKQVKVDEEISKFPQKTEKRGNFARFVCAD